MGRKNIVVAPQTSLGSFATSQLSKSVFCLVRLERNHPNVTIGIIVCELEAPKD